MKEKLLNWTLFILSGIVFFISIILFAKLGIYVDEYGTSPNIVYGGDFWLYMAWLRIFLSFGIAILIGTKLFKKYNA